MLANIGGMPITEKSSISTISIGKTNSLYSIAFIHLTHLEITNHFHSY